MVDPDDYDREPDDRICDDDCRGANQCHGHAFCAKCGEEVCGCELTDDLCPNCDNRRRTCYYCGDWVFVEDAVVVKDKYFCSENCRHEWENENGNDNTRS